MLISMGAIKDFYFSDNECPDNFYEIEEIDEVEEIDLSIEQLIEFEKNCEVPQWQTNLR